MCIQMSPFDTSVGGDGIRKTGSIGYVFVLFLDEVLLSKKSSKVKRVLQRINTADEKTLSLKIPT